MNGNRSTKIQSRSPIERTLDKGFYWAARIFALSIGGILIWITIQVAIQAVPAISEFGLGFLFSSSWNPVNSQYGVLPAVYGTVVSSFIALLIAVPIGLGVAIFLSEDYLSPKIQRIIVFLVELLAAVPSVVYGLWGIFVLIPFLKEITPLKGPGMLPAALILSVMILPTIAAIARDAIINVPIDLRQAAVGLGATRWEAILKIIVPAASSGIIGGIMLALGRALGETMAVTMLIGNANTINPSVFAPSNTISSLLANQFAEASGLQVAALMYAALILFAITLIVNILAQLLVTRLQKI
ncbi:phosphate ABC transporter membrane protein 1, PhoT family [Stanieria cyanosphaera PCC 7437]|uniref:Phosphate transport system permease protein n=1 Tax=Stanieria cyanosphaera (strain ATCC 29371 / PCC 7437) TaxID=111780 RepID=K9XTC6_STAC7|nr:phosphate ABC transporter permease subunit PstC [Stanieria cyanosphaera]AFZ34917.1 phosphate ABC transporter membrane protein 1, PhoT family [Stanieria cyanosphaera PCC 7437]